LIVLPEIEGLTAEEIKLVVNADWYDVYIDMGDEDQPTVFIMASAEKINHLGCIKEGWDIDLAELGGIVKDIVWVNDVLKRWDDEKFYHA